jgi:DNA helicase-2/ATP-dependent DNA helicase PcrA
VSELLSGLDTHQRQAAEALTGPVAIIAAAGSGKTRTVSHRIAHGVTSGAYDPRRTLALTFTTKASAELSRRLEELGAGPVATRTFHSAALRQLQFFWEDKVGGPMAKVAPAKAPMVVEALNRCNENADRARVRTLTAEIEWFKSAGLTSGNYLPRGAERTPQDTQQLRRIFSAYEDVKSDQGVIDFEDVLLIMIGLMQSRSDVREQVRRAYRWFTVDEFQDVSPLQMRLLRLWLGKRTDICVVGDPAQAIYGFAGADVNYLLGFPKEFPDAQVFELSTSDHHSGQCSGPQDPSSPNVATSQHHPSGPHRSAGVPR